MRYSGLATDYDGTLAKDGQVGAQTLAALERVKASGRKLILITGRLLEDLTGVFPQVKLFDWVVAENGALLYRPADGMQRLLGEPPSTEFLNALRTRGVPFDYGRVIVSTSHPYEVVAAEVIRALGLERQVILNKGAVMILPKAVDKGVALREVVGELNMLLPQIVGFGDAENDLAFLTLCGCGIAVANALPVVKEAADYITQASRGEGVIEGIEMLLAKD
ncbi:hypothetical protein KDA_57420 [Dictyobacter alpinus]|uniref:Haloacid dehalogenase n=1 Tax=Dictyobacter alpinus TaxID=2014873 RepID=A0A402BFS9_9CHLR|nr:HAD family hydrolase [Dictyobacter alpinus]GCE30258.1 hypothetical protein KDA_57420 [Dictyobacter alpinus]